MIEKIDSVPLSLRLLNTFVYFSYTISISFEKLTVIKVPAINIEVTSFCSEELSKYTSADVPNSGMYLVLCICIIVIPL